MLVSLIVPVLNEERLIYPLLTSLQQIKGQSSELIIVDGGSQDNTVALAEKFAPSGISRGTTTKAKAFL